MTDDEIRKIAASAEGRRKKEPKAQDDAPQAQKQEQKPEKKERKPRAPKKSVGDYIAAVATGEPGTCEAYRIDAKTDEEALSLFAKVVEGEPEKFVGRPFFLTKIVGNERMIAMSASFK